MLVVPQLGRERELLAGESFENPPIVFVAVDRCTVKMSVTDFEAPPTARAISSAEPGPNRRCPDLLRASAPVCSFRFGTSAGSTDMRARGPEVRLADVFHHWQSGARRSRRPLPILLSIGSTRSPTYGLPTPISCSDTVYAVSSWKEILFLLAPRAGLFIALAIAPLVVPGHTGRG